MSNPKGIHLFSNGTEFEIWEDNNCSRCVKEPSCDLLAALFTDGLTEGMYQGQVLPETAERLGYVAVEHRGRAGWRCKEQQPNADQPAAPWPPPLVQGELQQLPGMDAVAARPEERRGPWS